MIISVTFYHNLTIYKFRVHLAGMIHDLTAHFALFMLCFTFTTLVLPCCVYFHCFHLVLLIYLCHFHLVLFVYFYCFYLVLFCPKSISVSTSTSLPLHFHGQTYWLWALFECLHHPASDSLQIGVTGGHRFAPHASESPQQGVVLHLTLASDPLQIRVTGDYKFISERSWVL